MNKLLIALYHLVRLQFGQNQTEVGVEMRQAPGGKGFVFYAFYRQGSNENTVMSGSRSSTPEEALEKGIQEFRDTVNNRIEERRRETNKDLESLASISAGMVQDDSYLTS